jgi:hypothetical protein
LANQGQVVTLENSILTNCGNAISTQMSGTTTINYNLLYNNDQDFVTEGGALLVQGEGIITTSPNFVDFPNRLHLRVDSPAVNAANPQSDYSQEPGYNGGRADLGAYGNTRDATEQPPIEQMAVTLQADTSMLIGKPGERVTYTLTLKNTGSVTDTYVVAVRNSHGRFHTSLFEEGYDGARQFALGPQKQITVTVWDEIRVNPSQGMSNTFTVRATGDYGVQDEVQLTTQVSAFQEVGGLVVMEAEHFNGNLDRSNRSWLSQTDLPGYIGSGYLSSLPDTDLQFMNNYTTSSPELQYMINFTNTGTYYVWLRGYVPNGAGDSVYISLDDHIPTILTGFTPRTWAWAKNNIQSSPVTVEVTETGLHTFHLWQREDGLRLDRILLTTDSGYTLVGDGPSESEMN